MSTEEEIEGLVKSGLTLRELIQELRSRYTKAKIVVQSRASCHALRQEAAARAAVFKRSLKELKAW